MAKKQFVFTSNTLEFENVNGEVQVSVTDETGKHAVTVPKGQTKQILKDFEAVANEVQELTAEQVNAINERFGEMKPNKQPF